jgi:hypothetical protein
LHAIFTAPATAYPMGAGASSGPAGRTGLTRGPPERSVSAGLSCAGSHGFPRHPSGKPDAA